jgi:hypothetical protein
LNDLVWTDDAPVSIIAAKRGMDDVLDAPRFFAPAASRTAAFDISG